MVGGSTIAQEKISVRLRRRGFPGRNKLPMNMNKKTGGFTLVELLVTLAITAVLAGIVTLSLLSYTDYANFKRQNEYAQSLFVAAQNGLTHYSENGELENMAKTLERYAKGKTLTADMLQGEAKTNFEQKYKGRIYYITINKDGYVYDAPEGEAKEIKDIFDRIFDPYVYDKSILGDASVTIELDPVGGIVYSVLYSDIKSGFYYGSGGKDGYVSISDRDYDVRRENMIGYYGIENLSDETSRTKEKPVIETVRLVNSDSLYLQFRLSDKYAEKATMDLSYTFQVYNSDTQKLMMAFTLKNIKAADSSIPYSDLTATADVTLYGPDGSTKVLKDYTFLAFGDKNYNVHVMLDNVDLAAASAAEPELLKNTYSFHRFGLDKLWDSSYTNDIYVSVKGEGSRYKPSAWKRSNSENAYFASEDNKSNETQLKYTFGVKNSRHLYNIRFAEEMEESGKSGDITYLVGGSFAWGGTDGIFHGDYGSSVFTARVQTDEYSGDERTAFTPINELKDGHTFASSSNKYAVSELVLRGSGSGLGLFVKNSGTIRDAVIKDADVQGAEAVGTFCGKNGGKMVNLTTAGGAVRGKTDVGGIVGSDIHSENPHKTDIVYENLTNGSDVFGSRYVGGIIGSIDGLKHKYPVNIENCVNTGFVMGNLGKDADPTKKVQEDIVEDLTNKVNVNVEGSNYEDVHLDNPNNMFTAFKLLNGGKYPDLNAYDVEAITQVVRDYNIPGVKGYSGSYEEQVRKLCNDLIWTPCAVKDPNGSIQINGERYTVVLEAKERSRLAVKNDIEGRWSGVYFIYHQGTYYYSLHGWSKDINAFTFTNKQRNIFDLGTGDMQPGYTPDIGSGKAEHPDSGVTTIKNEPAYIGGIIGYAGAENNNVDFIIKDCQSSPQAEEDYIEALLAEDEAWENYEEGKKPLLGVYVGGIAGYSDGAVIENCVTGKGYVVGSSYVGGIVGYAEDTDLSSGAKENKANVIGKYNVGGVVGSNAPKGENDVNGFITLDNSIIAEDITGWKNRGMIIATQKYGGGITGYNTGKISSCSSEVEASQFDVNIAGRYSGDYMGGIAGYNVGSVVSDSVVNIVPRVYGKNYVGGVIGYNDSYVGRNADKSTTVYGYSCSGGYVEGENFVGGYAGLNLSARLFLGQNERAETLTAGLNEVKGTYFVGSIIGGNIVGAQTSFGDKTVTTDAINAGMSVNNFLGTVSARAFAGGFIGYNMSVNSAADGRKAAEALKGYSAEKELNLVITDLEALDISSSPGVAFNIDGNNNGCRLQGIEAQVYAGGVIGFNNASTITNISNVVNKTPVTGTGSAVMNELKDVADESPDNMNFNTDPYTKKPKTYSYAGGIVGKSTPKMTIDSCSSDDTGRVSSSGTYLGGLVEVNEGTIKNCKTGNIGNNGRNYVGGIAGLNKPAGSITASSLENKTIIGTNVVGGIASENFGEITGGGRMTVIAGNIYGYGENIGGLAGASYGSFTVGGSKGSAKVSNYDLNINISGTGVNVGGAIGLNSGDVDTIIYYGDMSASFNYSISGNTNVGSIIGFCKNAVGTMEGADNYAATITAAYGYAGGIVGKYEGTGSIAKCNNWGDVKVLGEREGYASFAGGIVGGLLSGTIDQGQSQGGNVTANKGGAGGVAGINRGKITGNSGHDSAVITGELYAGGVAAVNYGTISEGHSGKPGTSTTITDLAGVGNGYIGGIAGINYKGAEIEHTKVFDSSIIAASVNTKTGGVAGLNEGTVTGSGESGQVYNVKIGFTKQDISYYGYMGGVAGINTGTIEGYKIGDGDSVVITGSANNPEKPPVYDRNYEYETSGAVVYGYGGIAGLNGRDNGESSASIKNCRIGNLDISVIGDSYNIANIGGIAGVNGKGAKISNISFGINFNRTVSIKTTGSNAYAHMGGAAGYNYGDITDINYKRAGDFGDGSTESSELARAASADTESMVSLNAEKGHIGGMVGWNRQSGSIRRSSTGTNWSVKVNSQGQDTGAGGIVGYNSSARSITDCDNWADVIKTTGNCVGGIIGRSEVVSGTWYIENCNNFGNITGTRVSGIMGCLKYNGGTMYNCSNYGKITGVSESAGGIMGMVYDVTKDTVINITSCKNYGEITGKGDDAAGILAYVANRCKYIRVTVSDCVNTGRITANATNLAGIAARFDAAEPAEGYSDKKALVINGCRNFGNTSSAGKFSGIVQKTNAGKTVVKNCVGVAGRNSVTYPVSSVTGFDANSERNYYFTENKTNTGAGLGTPLYLRAQGGKSDTYNAYDAYSSGSAVFTELVFAKGKSYSDFIGDSSAGLRVMGGANNLRQTAYLNIMGRLGGAFTLPVPEITGEPYDNGGTVVLKWTASGNPYKFEVDVMADGETKTYTTFDNSLELSTEGLEGKTITFRVRSVPPIGDEKSAEDTAEYKVPSRMMPAPKFRFVLTSLASGNHYYKVVLDNAGEYAQYGQVKVHITCKGNARFQPIELTLNDGEITGAVNGSFGGNDGGASNYMITAQADNPDPDVGKSPAVSRESMIPGVGNYKGTATMGLVTVSGFTGDTPGTLAYNLAIKSNSGYSTYFRSEFLADDSSLGVPVVYSYGDSSVSQSSTAYNPTQLNKLPADLGNTGRYSNVSVRTYPISMANQICYTGFEIGSGYSESQLKALHVSPDGEMIESADNTDLLINGSKKKDGYIIYKDGDTYRLWFNPIVAASEKADSSGSGYNQYYNSQVYNYNNLDEKPGYPKYKGDFTVTARYDDAAQTYLAYWDGSYTNGRFTPANPGSVYQYSLIGETKNGSLETFKQGTLTAGSQDLVINESTVKWNYKRVELRVDRIGKESGGQTTEFGAASSAAVGTRLKLPTIPAPYAQLINKDGIAYKVAWSGIAEGTEEYGYLDSYNIILETTVQTSGGPKNITAVYNTGGAAADSGLVPNSMEIDLSKVTGFSSDSIEYTGYVAGGTPVTMRVLAVAKKGQEIYGDSADENISYRFELPTRLDKPVDGLTMVSAADGLDLNEAISIENFEDKGFKLTYKNVSSDWNSTFNGKYQLAAEIVVGDSVEATIASKENPITMNGTKLSEEAYCILTKNDKLTSRYAGKTLRLYIRAVSDNNISSLWSDPIDKSLPSVKVNTVDIGSAHSLADVTAKVYQNGVLQEASLNITQDTFSWTNDLYTNGYNLLLTRIDTPPQPSPYTKYVDGITITNGKGYKDKPVVSFVDVNDGDITTSVGRIIDPAVEETENSILYTYDLGSRKENIVDSSDNQIDGLELELKYELKIKVNSDGKFTNGVPGVKSVEYSLTLPESKLPQFENIAGSVSKICHYYSEISLTSVADRDVSVYFRDSTPAVAKRSGSSGDFEPETDLSKAKIAFAKQMSYYIMELNEIGERTPKASDPIIVHPIVIPEQPAEPSPGPSPTPGPTPSPTPSPSPSPTPGTPSPSPSPTPGTPSPEPTPDATPGPSPTPDPSPDPTAAPSPEPTPSPDPEETPSPEPTPAPSQAPDDVPQDGTVSGERSPRYK